MDEEEEYKNLLKLLLLLQTNMLELYRAWSLQRSKRWLNRRWSVRPINAQRHTLGHFKMLFVELRNDPEMFFRYTRMSVETFDYLNESVKPYLTKKRSNINSAQRLAVTLRYLASGDSILSIALDYRIGESTCRNIISETCHVIFEQLSPLYVTVPSEEEWKNISEGFLREWNMPNCCGAIDGKHIKIRAPYNSGSVYFNYKKTFSIILLAVCNHAYEFTLFDVGAAGSESDSGIFTRSELGKAMREKTLNFLNVSVNLPGTNTPVPFYFVGDEAFQLTPNLMRPYAGRGLDDKKLVFNYRLTRARRVIENSFGILAARWRFLLKPIAFQLSVVNEQVLAAVTLHNFLMKSDLERRNLYCPDKFTDKENLHGSFENGAWRVELQNGNLNNLNEVNFANETLNGHAIRDTLADYFMTPEGEVPWQIEYIRRGSYHDDV